MLDRARQQPGKTKTEHPNSWHLNVPPSSVLCQGCWISIWSGKHDFFRAMWTKTIGRMMEWNSLARQNIDIGRFSKVSFSMTMFFNVKRWRLLINECYNICTWWWQCGWGFFVGLRSWLWLHENIIGKVGLLQIGSACSHSQLVKYISLFSGLKLQTTTIYLLL